MGRKLLLILLAVILVTGWGCGHQTTGTGTQVKPSTREENTGSAGTATGDPGNRSGGDNLVIRSDNKVSDEEAKAMLEEVDRQLDEMVRMLEGLEEVNQSELEYGGEQP